MKTAEKLKEMTRLSAALTREIEKSIVKGITREMSAGIARDVAAEFSTAEAK